MDQELWIVEADDAEHHRAVVTSCGSHSFANDSVPLPWHTPTLQEKVKLHFSVVATLVVKKRRTSH